MFQWFARVTTGLMIPVILLILGAIFWGRQFDKFPAIYIQHISSNSTDRIILDFDTGIHYHLADTNDYSRSPNGRWEVREEWIDRQLNLYIHNSRGLNSRLLGIFEVPNLPEVLWASDSESLLLVYKSVDDDVVIEQIDVETGDAELWNTYEFSGTIRFAYRPNEDVLIIAGANESLIINMEINDFTQINDTYIAALPRHDVHYLAYGTTNRFQDISPEDSNLHILDLETLETISFTAEDFGGGIFNNMQWSPTEAVLPIGDINNHIVLYYAETHILERLPTEYEMYSNSGSWSYDGTRMIVIKRLNDEQIAYVILNLETGEEVELLRVNNRITSTPSLFYSQQLQWSPDDRYILSREIIGTSRLIFDIYDAETGEIVYSMDERLDFSLSNSYISWWWNS